LRLVYQTRYEEMATQRDFYKAALAMSYSTAQRIPDPFAQESRNYTTTAANSSLSNRQPERVLSETTANALL